MSARALRYKLYWWFNDSIAQPVRWWIVRRMKLEQRDWCWADIVMWAMGYDGIVGRDRFENCKHNWKRCGEDAARDGSCYCGRQVRALDGEPKP